MIKSMTGYGSGKCVFGGRTFCVEIKSVNCRYGDFSIKLPRSLSFLEETVRKACTERINRGKVDVYVNADGEGDACGSAEVNLPLAKSYGAAIELLCRELGIKNEISAADFLKIPDVFTVKKTEENEEETAACLKEALSEALNAFDAARTIEGEKLCADLRARLDFIENATLLVEKRSPVVNAEYEKKLAERMKEILQSTSYDEARLMTEVAVFADKTDINEEVVRLKSHISQLRAMLEGSTPVGRKMDFIIQEMNREINTVGSKSNDLEIARTVIDVKAEIEKLREQVQNIE